MAELTNAQKYQAVSVRLDALKRDGLPVPSNRQLAKELDLSEHLIARVIRERGAASQGETRRLPMMAISHDHTLQMRPGLDEAHVESLMEATDPDSDGQFVDLEPIRVYEDKDGTHRLADGHHTFEARLRLGCPDILAVVAEGDYDDALLAATHANAMHGLPRCAKTRRKAVESLLRHPKFRSWTNDKIADQAMVHRATAARVRAELSESGIVTTGYVSQKNGQTSERKSRFKAPAEAPLHDSDKLPTISRNATYPSDHEDSMGQPAGGHFLDGMEDEAEAGDEAGEGQDDPAPESAPVTEPTMAKPKRTSIKSILDLNLYPLYSRLADDLKPVFALDVAVFDTCSEQVAIVRKVVREARQQFQGMAALGRYTGEADVFTAMAGPLGGGTLDRRTTGWVGCSHCLRDAIHTGRAEDGHRPCHHCGGRGYYIPRRS